MAQKLNEEKNINNVKDDIEITEDPDLNNKEGEVIKIEELQLHEIDEEFIKELSENIEKNNKPKPIQKQEDKELKKEEKNKLQKQDEESIEVEQIKELVVGGLKKLFVNEEELRKAIRNLKRNVQEVGGNIEIILKEIVTNNLFVNSFTFYLLIHFNRKILFEEIKVVIKEKEGDFNFLIKEKMKILEIGDFESIGIHEEEGNQKIFVKYVDGRINELKVDENIKTLFISWLKKNNLIIDLKIKYGIINNDHLHINWFADDFSLIFEDPISHEKEEVKVGNYNPYSKFYPFFLDILSFKKQETYSFNPHILEIIKEGVEKNTKIKIIVGYSLATLIKDWIKKTVSVFPHLWLFSGQGGTGKTSLLHLIKLFIGLKEFETAMSIAQIRNVMNVRNNVVLIDDIESFGTPEIKKIIRSLLKVSATDSIQITLGDGQKFVLTTPLAITSNRTPKEILETDEALQQRMILLNINKGEIDRRWLKDFRNLRNMPDIYNVKNNLLAFSWFFVKEINKRYNKERIIEKLVLIRERVIENIYLLKKTYEELLEEDRLIDMASIIILGVEIFYEIILINKKSTNEEIKEIIQVIIENNEVFKGESFIYDIVELFVDEQSLSSIDKDLIEIDSLLKTAVDMGYEREKLENIPLLMRYKNKYLFLINSIKKQILEELKTINKKMDYYSLLEILKSIGCNKRRNMFVERDFLLKEVGDDRKIGIIKKKKKIRKTFLEIPEEIIDRIISKKEEYLLLDLDGDYVDIFTGERK